MGILKRTKFYHQKGEYLAEHSWCLVNTTLGTMLEPMKMNRFNNDGQDFDLTDECCRVDEIKIVDINKLYGLPPFADEGVSLVNGIGEPKAGF